MHNFAQAISWIFNPLLMPIYGLLLVMYIPSDHLTYNPYCMYYLPVENKISIVYIFLLFGFAAPGLSFYLLQRRNIIQSIEMDSRKERTIPIVIMFAYCLMLYILLLYLSKGSTLLPKYLYALPLSGVLVTFVFFFLNRWKKISIHSAASGILVGFILAYIIGHVEFKLIMLAIAIVISGLVMSARLFLEKHTLTETIIGWVIGAFITFSVNYFYFY